MGSGIHCWRIHTINPNRGYILWGVSGNKHFEDASYNDATVIGATTEGGHWSNGNKKEVARSHFKVTECEVDMFVDIEQRIWKLCRVGRTDIESDVLVIDKCVFNEGIVPYFNIHADRLTIRIAKIP